MEHTQTEHDTFEQLMKIRLDWEHWMIMCAAGQNKPEQTLVLLAKEMRRFDAALKMLKGEGL